MASTQIRRVAPETERELPPMADGLGTFGWLAFLGLGAVVLLLTINF